MVRILLIITLFNNNYQLLNIYSNSQTNMRYLTVRFTTPFTDEFLMIQIIVIIDTAIKLSIYSLIPVI